MRGVFRRLLVSTALSVIAVLAPPIVCAQAAYQFELPAQSLADSLRAIGRQTSTNILFESHIVKDVQAPALYAQLTISEAIGRLLVGTPLSIRRTSADTLIVERATRDASKVQEKNTVTPSTSAVSEMNGYARLSQAQIQNAEQAEDRATAQSPSESSEKRIELDEIVVTGSRLRGTAAEAVPVTIFDRQKLDELGVTSVSEVLNYLPQQPAMNFGNRFGAGAVFAELRGVGLETTLVLINGRRAPPTGNSILFNAFDLRTIPLAAVERVEVLSDSASAVYGADAVGGVVNVILKKEIPRPVVELQYGAADGGARERRVSLGSGYSNERFRGALLADYFDRGALPGGERDLTANQDYRRFGSLDRRSIVSNPGNVCSTDGSNLPGLPNRCAAVPQGSTGVGLSPADFLATAGQQNRESLSRWSGGKRDRGSVLAFAEFDLSVGVTAFGDFLYVDGASVAPSSPSGSRLTVPASNPFNPFGTAVSVDYRFSGLGPRLQMEETELYRAVLGVRGGIGTWDWELSVLDTDGRSALWNENGVDAARANAALNATDPSQALNVFQDGPGGSRAFLASLVAPPSSVINDRSESTQGHGFVRGSLFALPAGRVEVVLGGEARGEKMTFGGSSFQADRDVSAIFSEMRVPLVSADMQIPAIKGLALTVAGRHDHYSDFGDTFNPQYGLVWTPVEELALRLAYSTSFQAPSLNLLFSPSVEVEGIQVTDPQRNNETVAITGIFGGNPQLHPVEADSLTVGFVFSQKISGLQLSASYWQVNLENRARGLDPAEILAFQNLFPGRVVRAAPTPADIAANMPGRIESIDGTVVNFGSVETSGVDVSVLQSVDTQVGRFALRLSGTWLESHRASDVPNAPLRDLVGTTRSELGALPRWRAVGTLGWTRQGLGISATARYKAPIDDATEAGSTGRVIPPQTLVDIQGSIDLGERASDGSSWLNHLKVSVGMLNLFDRLPSFAEVRGTQGYDPSQGDIRGRFGYMSVSKAF